LFEKIPLNSNELLEDIKEISINQKL